MIELALAGPVTRSRLTHVSGPNPVDPNMRIELKTKAELETMCLEEAGHCFTQAATAPFLTLPLINIFMESNLSTHAFDQVLAGTFACPDEVDEMMKQLLSALQQPQTILGLQPRTLDEITAGWRKPGKLLHPHPPQYTLGTTWLECLILP